MADLRVVPAALVVWMALFTGVACASDQIVLSCSGDWFHIIHEGQEPSQYGAKVNNEHVIIDLDKKTVSAWSDT